MMSSKIPADSTRCRRQMNYALWLLLLIFPDSLKSLCVHNYETARQLRASSGHKASVELFKELLERNPDDLSVAVRLSAASGSLMDCICNVGFNVDDSKLARIREWFVRSDYTAKAVKEVLQIVEPHARAPIYVKPAQPGTVRYIPFGQQILNPLQTLTTLYMLGLSVPSHRVGKREACYLVLLQELGLLAKCEADPSLWVPVVSITPMNLDDAGTLLLVTDWHPIVLNTIHIGSEQPVMYIGPDSLALVQHFIFDPYNSHQETVLDLCTGSGVQALAFCAMQPQVRTAVVVDVNPRALRFAKLNAALNGLSQSIKGYVEADLMKDCAGLLKMGPFDVVTANPPFLPVPSALLDRHGLFSAGGDSGEAVLASVMELSSQVLKPDGCLAAVSEFFFEKDDDSSSLLCRLERYWEGPCRGLLLTNERPIASEEYAKRRGDSTVWMEHFSKYGICSCSPGLLYVKNTPKSRWKHGIVPRSAQNNGSIWTPSNRDAIVYSRRVANEELS